ncbi:hypothetical protein MTR_5g093220 [Medicago truncatula]|uniref:Uncharacterized protein n=1 Tax=Medicago truncatula TaxID=3880 RepID=G7K3L3_MEDTR|nr:hypothetical protein MTR_5g093220 [Medicago truncatula]
MTIRPKPNEYPQKYTRWTDKYLHFWIWARTWIITCKFERSCRNEQTHRAGPSVPYLSVGQAVKKKHEKRPYLFGPSHRSCILDRPTWAGRECNAPDFDPRHYA